MRHMHVGILMAWLVGCLIGGSWLLLGGPGPVRAEEPDLAAEAALQTDKLLAASWMADQRFGQAVAFGQDFLVIGRPEYVAGQTSTHNGSAYIFARDPDNPNRWIEAQMLTASDGLPDDRFGTSVAISGDTVVIGAPNAAVDGFQRAGAAYVFRRDKGGTNNWVEATKLSAGDVFTNGDSLGSSVAIDGATIVVGAPLADILNQANAGAAYVFHRVSGDNWDQSAKLRASSVAPQDRFGYSVAVHQLILAIGAPYDNVFVNSIPILDRGSVYVFYGNPSDPMDWSQHKALTATDGSAYDDFGVSVGLEGDTIVVGAHQPGSSSVPTGTGAAYVYSRDASGTDQWGEIKKITAPDGVAGDWFGYSVDVGGDKIVVGAITADVNGNVDQGAAYTFQSSAGGPDNWGLIDKLVGRDSADFDWLGYSVATNGVQFLVGAPRANMGTVLNTGAAYVFVGNARLVHLPVIQR